MQFPILIGLHRSFFLAVLLVSAHLVAMVALCLPGWPWYIVAGGLGVLIFSLLWNWRQLTPQIECLRLLDNGQLECQRIGAGGFTAARLLPDATVHPWLTSFQIEDAVGKVALLVLPDSTGSAERRRLRQWLRWRADFTLPLDDDL